MLDILVLGRADSRRLDVNVVYWVTACMQARARGGYEGLGSVRFRQASGLAFKVSLAVSFEWSGV